MQQVYYPDDGDDVKLSDGRSGKVTSSNNDPLSTGPGEWQLDVEFEGDDEDEQDVEVSWNEKEKCWEEKD